MKKIIILLFFILPISLIYANSWDVENTQTGSELEQTQTNSWDLENMENDFVEEEPTIPEQEEKFCFEILSENVKKQYGLDLSRVEESSESWDIINLSNYDDFKKHTVKNPSQQYLTDSWLNIFAAKRNNIWTIRTTDDYILSQFAWFWDGTNFTFPLKSSNSEYISWDTYPDFRQNILYTHHLLDWSFVSCAYLKVTPIYPHNLYSISQDGYKTNIFEGSWFEILDSSVKKQGQHSQKEYLVWKVSIAANDYADKRLFDIDLITIAYNNKSKYFNEFETFPKQVSAMTNTDAQKEWMVWVMVDFFNKVKNETCLELIHKPWDYPSKCNNQAKSLSFFDKIVDFFSINKSFAAITPVKNYKEKMQKARWMVIYDWLPMELYKKLQKIKDENFKNALTAAVVPNFEDMIKYKQKNNILLTPYEEIFIKCSMDYSKRMKNVIHFLKNLDLESWIDYKNLDYLDSKFWDCIIPYPDKDNLWKKIENSFESIKKDYVIENDISQKIEEKYSQILELETMMNQWDKNINEKLKSWQPLTDEEIEESNLEKQRLKKQHDKLSMELKQLIDKSNEKQIENLSVPQDKNKLIEEQQDKKGEKNILMYILIAFMFSLWVLFMYLAIKKKK